MNIYVAHSKDYDYKNNLYNPIREFFADKKEVTVVYPHEHSDKPYNSKSLFESGCSLVIAEISYPSIGMGIELGWADSLNIPVVCLLQADKKLSGSIKVITNEIYAYNKEEEILKILKCIYEN